LSWKKSRARVALPQSLINDVRQKQQAWVWVGPNQLQQVKAESLTISPFADEQSHTFLVRVNLPEGEHHVYPGMHTKVAFLTGTEERLVIPAAALVRRSEVTGVYVSDAGKSEFRYIRAGRPLSDNRIEVLSGLAVGEQVLLDPAAATMAITSPGTTTATDKE
jgi:multidrug efflux pump subunit AcrA (membrane-fusion protein)